MNRIENHEKHCEVCAAGYKPHCHDRDVAEEIDALEAEVAALKAAIAKARTHLHPGIQLTNESYQASYRYAAAQVLAILGEP